MTRVIITGDRNWDYETADEIVARLKERHGDVTIIHGGAAGVDRAFATAGAKAGCEVIRFNADWQTLGKAAGPIRNAQMIACGADFVLAFHRFIRNSKGTKDCCRQAMRAEIPVWLIDGEGNEPRRVTEEMLV